VKKKPPLEPLDLAHTFEETVVVEGVPVSVRFHVSGEPISWRVPAWWGDDPERMSLARLRIDKARSKIREALRTSKSVEKRHKAQLEHWVNKWLGEAHQANPTFRAERLALAARQMLAVDQDRRGKEARRDHLAEAKERDEITEYRADVYLKAIRTKSGEV
jgi:hypothetical protein